MSDSCNSMDCSPPGSFVHGILQARTLEWVAISFSIKLLQPSPNLCDPMDCKPIRLLSPWDSLGKNTGVSCHFLFQGIFPTQRLNQYLLLGRWILHH